MSFANEFAIVDMIVASQHETRGIDAFSLSIIKTERQMRKLFTHLIFQYPCFDGTSVSAMRDLLGAGRNYYFEGFERGVDAVAPRTVAHMIGGDYASLRERLSQAMEIRNKVFHGQVTKTKYMTRDELLGYVADIRCWCETFAEVSLNEIGYDGFGRNSLRKCRPNLANTFKYQIASIDGYRRLLKEHVARPVHGGGK